MTLFLSNKFLQVVAYGHYGTKWNEARPSEMLYLQIQISSLLPQRRKHNFRQTARRKCMLVIVSQVI